MPLVQLLASHMARVHLVVEHRLKLALTSRRRSFRRLDSAAANNKLVVGCLVAAIGGD